VSGANGNGRTSAEDLARLRQVRFEMQERIRAERVAEREHDEREPDTVHLAAEFRALRDRVTALERLQEEQTLRINRAGRIVKELSELVKKIDKFLTRKFS
jgi:uncharacterized coiled-coil DUF342 family protein